MTREEALAVVTMLVEVYPREVQKETIRAYALHLTDARIDKAAAVAAVKRLVATAKFLPTVAEIREAIAANAAPEWPTPGDAWARVMWLVRKVGSYGVLPTVTPFDRMVKRCIEGVGGWTYLCDETENIMADRAHFLRVYAENVARERQRDAAQVWPLPGQEQRPAIEATSPKVATLVADIVRSVP